jgi:TonB family protein
VVPDTTIDASNGGARGVLQLRVRYGPAYPVPQRNAGQEGQVRVSFVIDTLGRVVRGTAEITEESARAFGQSVCVFLRSAKYAPIVLAGRPRTVWIVNQNFGFRLGAPPGGAAPGD